MFSKTRLSFFIALVLITLFLTGCGEERAIETNVNNFFKEINLANYPRAASFTIQDKGACLDCHNDLNKLEEILPPGNLDYIEAKKVEVNSDTAKAYLELQTKDGKRYKTKYYVDFYKEKDGNWRLDAKKLKSAIYWARLEQGSDMMDTSDLPNAIVVDEKNIDISKLKNPRYALPEHADTIPISENPLKPTGQDSHPHIYWSNKVTYERGKIDFSPAIMSYVKYNENPPWWDTPNYSDKIAVGAWIINTTDKTVKGLKNVRLSLYDNAGEIAEVQLDRETLNLQPNKMQYRLYLISKQRFKRGKISLDTVDFNKVNWKFEYESLVN